MSMCMLRQEGESPKEGTLCILDDMAALMLQGVCFHCPNLLDQELFSNVFCSSKYITVVRIKYECRRIHPSLMKKGI